MADNFDWQTEEDEIEPWPGKPPPSHRSRRKVPAVVLLLLLVTGASAFWLYRQGQARVAGVTAAVEADVLSLHELVQQASNRQDIELFSPLLSGRDPAWAELQDELVARGYLNNRAFWGLAADAAPSPPFGNSNTAAGSSAAVILAADLQFAEVRYQQNYRLAGEPEETAPVRLQQTAFYGYSGAGRWLLAPPGADFWGERQTVGGDRLTAHFPERDRAVALRLASDLELFLDDLCHRLPDLNCPAGLAATLELQGGPEALLNAARPVPLFDTAHAAATFTVILPTPTLVGLPVDEAGYQALLRGYAGSLAAAAIAYLVDYTCCEGAPFFEALLQYQLSRLGLRPWPVDAALYRRHIEESPLLDNLAALWRPPNDDALAGEHGWQLYLLTDFLLETLPNATAATLQKQLVSSHAYLGWLIGLMGGWPDLTGDPLVMRSLDQRLRYHAYLQLLPSETAAPPTALPEQDLMLLCYDPFQTPAADGIAGTLYRLDLRSRVYTPEEGVVQLALMNRLPGYDAFLLHQVTYAPQLTRTTLHQNGQARTVYSNDVAVLTFGQTDPAGRQAVLYTLGPEAGTRISLLPIEPSPECDSTGCQANPVPGLPHWSPDGRETLLLWPVAGVTRVPALYWQAERLVALHDADALARLYRGDGRGERLAGDSQLRALALGYAPFWLDNESYGYVRLSASGGAGVMLMATPHHVDQEVVVASVHDDEPHLLFGLVGLRQHELFESWPEHPLFIRYVLANPANADHFVVSLFDAGRLEGYLFSFDRASGAFKHLLTLDHNAGQSAAFTPDGRWLAVTGNSQADLIGSHLATTLYLFDWAQQEMESIYIRRSTHFSGNPAYDWSSDGRWLAALTGSGHVLLMAPEHGYRQLIPHGAGDCVSLIWQNR